jgi:hypothetical protein
MEDRLGEVEHALNDPDQLPGVVRKVKELLRTVNGDAGGPPGAGIDARFHASRRNNPAVGTISSFNLSLGTGNSMNSFTVSQQEEITELRRRCAWLRKQVRRPSLLSLAADKTDITCTKVDVKYSYQISLIQIMISNLDPLLSSKVGTNYRAVSQ